MPLKNISQPNFIVVDQTLRLRRFDAPYDFALVWYQDRELVWLVDGLKTPYTIQKLTAMYEALNKMGECYFIEILANGVYRPIGDVTFSRWDMPIVIGEKALRGQKIATRVIGALINRARQLGFTALHVAEIYDWNTASMHCFQKIGFKPYQKTAKGYSYQLLL